MVTRAEAREKGLSWYFTGKPCKKGHIDRRYTSNATCFTCAREAAKTCRDTDRESYNEYHREYSGRNLHLIEKYLRDPKEIWF